MTEELDYLRSGNEAVAKLFGEFRSRLIAMIEFRLDRRIVGRIDPEDIVQEAWVLVSGRIADYLAAPNVSFYVWVRQITRQLLIDAQRRHFSMKRDASLDRAILSRDRADSAESMSQALADSITSPSRVIMRAEEAEQLQKAIESISEMDQEILSLRHFEQLSSIEVAQILGIGRTAASNRYLRALKRLQQVLNRFPAFRDSGAHNPGDQE